MREMRRLIAASVFSAALLTGCAWWFHGTNVASKDPNCTAACDRNYSACAGQGPTATSPSINPEMCSAHYADCVRRCPAK
jgi:hypothetical protein